MTPKEWLDSGRDYEQGRQLYAALGENERLQRLLAQGPNHYNVECLAWELTKLSRLPVAAPVSAPVPAPALVPADSVPIPAPLPVDDSRVPAPVPAPVAALLEELAAGRRPRYDERSGIHMQLEGLATDADRFEACQRIMQLSRELDANWETTKYVQAHGQLPPPPAAAPDLATLGRDQLLARRNNLRSQVSKLKKKPARAADLVQAQTDLAQVEALLQDE